MTTGTKEWASSNVNIQYGCENGCRYCYAYKMASRFKNAHPYRKGTSWEDWENPKLNQKAIEKGYGKRKGRIMFPSTHDITENNIIECVDILTKILKAGNEVLITTKPRYYCIFTLIDDLLVYRDQIQFRFTITSNKQEILNYWEPHAPDYQERFNSLKFAHKTHFKTSLSIEPILSDPTPIILDCARYVTESIWLGALNNRCVFKNIRDNMPEETKKWNEESLLKEKIPQWATLSYGTLRLKDSIKHLGV